MTIYFCINEVLDTLEESGQDASLKTLISVKLEPPECNGHRDDAFMLSSFPKLLDLREPGAADHMAHILEQVPLYNINLELILDEALAERHLNPHVETALGRAFGNQPLPNTLKPLHAEHESMTGGLRHPMLGHMDKTELCELYIRFIKALERGHDHYSFERNILGKHAERFTEHYDGFVTARDGKVKAEILIGFGQRLDHDPGKPLETHTRNGEKLARNMNIEEPKELVWAWLEADNYQMRRSLDLDRILHLKRLPRRPNWVRADIFSLLEKEAMKQIFAQSLVAGSLDFLNGAPALQKAIQHNGAGQVDEGIQQLLAQTLNTGVAYAGAAERFAEQAAKRAAEAKKITLT